MKAGIVMGDSGIRGIYAAGVLDVLLEHGIKADGLVGISADAIHGCSFAAGQAGRSIHCSLKYCRDPRYMSLRSLVATGDLVGNEFYYRELPERPDLLDNDTLEASSMRFYTICAGVETGRSVYHRCDSLRGENTQWIRASASMPLVSRIVEIGGHGPLDGEVSDSVPAAAFRKISFGRNPVILTWPDGYHKKPNHILPAIRRVYRKCPEFVKIMECHHLMYNRELEEIRHVETAEEIFVIRPSHLIKINRTESKPEKIQQMYELGHLDGMEALQNTTGFLGMEPAVYG